MKKIIFVLVIVMLAAGGAVTAMSGPSHAQVYTYAPPPGNIYAHPWVGPGTPWVYYNGDWFLNGILYYFFGPLYGWAPYYAYPPVYIVRSHDWYAPKWRAWYLARPKIVVHFHQRYPYWKGHTHTHRYDRVFYEKHHRGRGAGWQGGFRGVKPKAVPEKPVPSKVAPPARRKPAPAPARVVPPETRRPAPSREAPPKVRKPAPSQVAPPARPKPAPARVAPPPRPKPAPPQAAPPARPQPGPAVPGARAPRPEKKGPDAPKPEKRGPGGDK